VSSVLRAAIHRKGFICPFNATFKRGRCDVMRRHATSTRSQSVSLQTTWRTRHGQQRWKRTTTQVQMLRILNHSRYVYKVEIERISLRRWRSLPAGPTLRTTQSSWLHSDKDGSNLKYFIKFPELRYLLFLCTIHRLNKLKWNEWFMPQSVACCIALERNLSHAL
jgi:hypothetical protein